MKKTTCFLVGGVLLSVLLGVPLFAQTRGEDLAMLNRMMKLKMDGLIPLRFINALDGTAAAGAAVSIEGIGSFTANREGIISFPEQEDGFYTLVFSCPGFITAEIEFEVKLRNVFNNRISVSPLMRGDYLRIVLDWGETPADLDLHLEKAGTFHVSYRNMHSPEDGSVILDRDDRSGFGPETITIMETDTQGVYRLYVIDYTNGNNRASAALSRSGAAVRVYSRKGLVKSFRVPP
ncbi:MAG: hypothetical protein LBB68_11165, partial [Treponema sp.]|nr:hypothetical protein [Treponema sp.]